ncbi:MAG: alpha/beta hydrolase [Planctomycetota bacterium]
MTAPKIEARDYRPKDAPTKRAALVLHGGPGAIGSAASLAEELGRTHRVWEPLQRTSDDGAFTVRDHLHDHLEFLRHHCPDSPPALVGSSWGAMLALAMAAEAPAEVGPLVLVGCGTYDPVSRHDMRDRIVARTSPELRREFDRIANEIADEDDRLAAKADLIFEIYTVDPLVESEPCDRIDARGNRSTWDDMIELQESGVYPQALASITAPVLMLHGTEDPHPGPSTRDELRQFIPHLEYVEWEECGHYPWIERKVREPFFETLRSWLDAQP